MKSDLISRQATIDLITTGAVALTIDENDDALDVMEKTVTQMKKWMVECIAEQPSAQPERKTGRWLIREGISDAQCSECKMYFKDVYDMDNSDAFCRHCGAKMEGLKVVKDG